MCYCLAVALFCVASVHSSACAAVTAATPIGDIIGHTGQLNVSGQQTTLTRFLGVPYAESTAGANRFRKPVAKAPFAQPFDAADYGEVCFQAQQGSEDCLHLNIYVPGIVNQTTRLPVMIWIHGGAFVKGSAMKYNPDVLCMYGNVIVVTINYRLGELGFLSTGNSQSPGNYGLWDQHLAIQWVNRNIGSFGGDPNEVTIFGESAGGASCLLQALYSGNSGLFKRVIAESGTALNGWSFTNNNHKGVDVLKANNCSDMDCLRTKTVEELRAVQISHHLNGFIPSIDHEFLRESPSNILVNNHHTSTKSRDFFASLDIMTGVNSMEGALTMNGKWKTILHLSNAQKFAVTLDQFENTVLPSIIRENFGSKLSQETQQRLASSISSAYLNATERADPLLIRDKLLKMFSDLNFFLPAIRTVESHARLAASVNTSTYFYEFAERPTHRRKGTPNWVKGPTHTEEIQFVLGNVVTMNDTTDAEKDLSLAMMSMWTNFAKTGNPNTPTDVKPFTHTAWPRYNMTSQQYVTISSNMSPSSVRDHFRSDIETLWRKALPAIVHSHNTGPAIVG